MIREIKFRLFTGKIMKTWETLSLVKNFGKILDGKLNSEKWVLMQYTGLKDKNGVEIYEGDIIEIDCFEGNPYQVGFNRGGFCFYKSEDDAFYNDIKYTEKSIIKGNIYENSNLLDNK